MNKISTLKRDLARVSRLWKQQRYDDALNEVEALLQRWPGNAHLHVLWASLVQLQESSRYELGEAKEALAKAVELDKGSPAAEIELAHFLDCVEDDPESASEVYDQAVKAARRLLLEGLIGQAKSFRQLNRREDFHRCLLEILLLSRFEKGYRKTRAAESGIDLIFGSSTGFFQTLQWKGPYSQEIQDLLNEVVAEQSI